MSKEDEIGALWEKDGAKGPFMSGKIGDQAVVAFRNDKKKNPREPDWRILKAQPRPKPATDTDGPIPF
jgi:hypothetical protein